MNTLVVDTNILLVYLVGLADPNIIRKHKRTRSYSPDDWDTIHSFFQSYQSFHTTTSILTETSNLLPAGTKGARHRHLMNNLKSIVELWPEHALTGKECVQDAHYERFGITDVGILKLAKSQLPGAHVLTDDLDLFLLLRSQGVHAFNFNHLRGNRFGVT